VGHGGDEKCIKMLIGKPGGKRLLEDLGINEIIVLKLFLGK
jgi:hypothetical protein